MKKQQRLQMLWSCCSRGDRHRAIVDIFRKHPGPVAKRLIALTSLPSGMSISRTFWNSGKRSSPVGRRATLPVEQTQTRGRSPP
jgi:hypothetical protein